MTPRVISKYHLSSTYLRGEPALGLLMLRQRGGRHELWAVPGPTRRAFRARAGELAEELGPAGLRPVFAVRDYILNRHERGGGFVRK